MSANIEYAAADIAARVPDLALEGTLNRTNLLINIIKNAVELEVAARLDDWRDQMWHLGWCPVCKSEINHDITEPFAECNCLGSFGEATEVPLIPKLRHEIAVLKKENRELIQVIKTGLGSHSFKTDPTS